jgi:hypothetical protein
MMDISLSHLPHTWFIDVDGTLLEHNGHLNGSDKLLPGVIEFWDKIPCQDMIILLSARKECEREATLRFIQYNGLRYDAAFFGLPTGERILINDIKPRGLFTAVSVNIKRDSGLSGITISNNKTQSDAVF